MNHIGIFLRVLLGLCVGSVSLFSFSLAPYAMAHRDFSFFGGEGVMITVGIAMGGLLEWIAFRLISGAFRADKSMTRMLQMSAHLAPATIVALMLAKISAAGPLIGPGEDEFDREIGEILFQRRQVNYEFFRPPGHADADKLPLVVYLHGFSDGLSSKQTRLNDTMRDLVHATQRDNAFRGISEPVLAEQYDDEFAAYLLVPKIPVVEGWDSRTRLVRQLMEDLADDYSIDDRRIYLTGFSNGGFATINMIREFPGLFAAGVPISGGADPNPQLVDALKETPLWIFHGSDDFTVDPDLSINLVNELRAAGGNVRLSLPFGGHNAGYEAAFRDRGQEFYPWLFSQSLPVPEPATGVLIGLATLVVFRIRRRTSKKVCGQPA